MNPIRSLSRLRRLALVLLLGLTAGAALAEPPSDADVNRLLAASRAQSMIDGMLPQMEAMQQKQFDEAFRGRQVTPAEADQLRRIQERSRQTVRDVLSWSKLRPLYVDLYKQSFSKQDVLAMAEFYESPAGQSLLDKTPALMQNVMIALQKLLQPAMADLDRDLDRIIRESSPAAPREAPAVDVPPSPPAR
ncbi:DUF2059 domain-containing protein [Xanthomonas medicagonis]|uniref:DUF2059 domain-containing protein n=1 Tax=Xanthomonas medicagonis TaxID=3160841 RepID=UPI003511722B